MNLRVRPKLAIVSLLLQPKTQKLYKLVKEEAKITEEEIQNNLDLESTPTDLILHKYPDVSRQYKVGSTSPTDELIVGRIQWCCFNFHVTQIQC